MRHFIFQAYIFPGEILCRDTVNTNKHIINSPLVEQIA